MDVGILLVLSLVIDEVISGRGREVISKREKRMQSAGFIYRSSSLRARHLSDCEVVEDRDDLDALNEHRPPANWETRKGRIRSISSRFSSWLPEPPEHDPRSIPLTWNYGPAPICTSVSVVRADSREMLTYSSQTKDTYTCIHVPSKRSPSLPYSRSLVGQSR
jgi:hypothetical protein